MHEQILQEIEQIKSNKEFSPQQKLDALFEIRNYFAEKPFLAWITSESRNIMFLLVTYLFFLVTYRNQDIELFFNIPMYFFPIIVMAMILIDKIIILLVRLD